MGVSPTPHACLSSIKLQQTLRGQAERDPCVGEAARETTEGTGGALLGGSSTASTDPEEVTCSCMIKRNWDLPEGCLAGYRDTEVLTANYH